jgi:hypothetical protein
VSAFGKRAFRRPLTTDEKTSYANLFQQGATLLGGDALVSGVEMVVRTMLQSPHFIYRIESSTQAQGDVIWLSSYEIATRLSYTLWNTMPSDELLAAAEREGAGYGGRRDPLGGPHGDQVQADGTIRTFHEQLLKVASFGSVAKDPTRFPNFTPALAPVLQSEARMFLDQLLVKQGAGFADVLTAPFTFVNDQTAPFYGLTPKYGTTMTRSTSILRSELASSRRSGFWRRTAGLPSPTRFTAACPSISICSVTKSTLRRTWCRLCRRRCRGKRIDSASTNTPRCAAPVATTGIINPVGFAFEHYDAVGAWRDIDNSLPVDAKASFSIDGKTVTYDGALELGRLISQSRQFYDCYAKNWLEYVLGRTPVDVEAGSIDKLATTSKAGTSTRDLLVGMTGLVPFRARSATEGGTP